MLVERQLLPFGSTHDLTFAPGVITGFCLPRETQLFAFGLHLGICLEIHARPSAR